MREFSSHDGLLVSTDPASPLVNHFQVTLYLPRDIKLNFGFIRPFRRQILNFILHSGY